MASTPLQLITRARAAMYETDALLTRSSRVFEAPPDVNMETELFHPRLSPSHTPPAASGGAHVGPNLDVSRAYNVPVSRT